MSSTVPGFNWLLLSETTNPAVEKSRSLAALEAGMERIERAMCATFGNLVACSFHQLRTSKFSSLGDLKSMYALTSS